MDTGELDRVLVLLHRVVAHSRPSDTGESGGNDDVTKSGDSRAIDAFLLRLLCGLEASRALLMVSDWLRASYAAVLHRKNRIIAVSSFFASFEATMDCRRQHYGLVSHLFLVGAVCQRR